MLAFDLDRVAAGPRVVVPARQETLGAVRLIGGRLVAEYLVDVQSRVETFDPSTGAALGALALPGPGVVSALHGRGRHSDGMAGVHVAAAAGHRLRGGPGERRA